MRMYATYAISALLVVASSAVVAQTREETLQELSVRLERIQEQLASGAVAMSGTYPTTQAEASMISQRFKEAIEGAAGIAEWLDTNPHVELTGFSVGLSFAPSINFDFLMKKPPGPAASTDP